MSAWKPVCLVSDIPRQGARILQRQGLPDVAIFRTRENQIFALVDRCPHKGGPLSQGMLIGDKVACPLHNWHIDLATGEAVAPDQGCAARFQIRLEHEQVLLDETELQCLGKI